MSQRGPGPRPASRRSSRSPVRSDQLSPVQYAPQPGSNELRYEPVNTSADTSRHAQQLPPKALGVHNILNPPEPRPASSEAGGRPPSRSRDLETASSTLYGVPRPYFPGHAASNSVPATPVVSGVTPLARPPMSERNSPSTPFQPFPNLSNSRKILSPRGPRSMSLSQALPPRDLDPRQQPLAPSAPPAKRPYEPDAPDEPRPPPGLHQPPMASGGHHPIVTPPRSLSQPGDIQGRSQVLHAPAPFQHGIHGVPTSRPLSRMGATGEGTSPWPEMLRRPGVGSAFVGMEAQQAYMTLPGSDTPIPVQVDYSQASKKADEKRQRNAKASTRHRRKKKTLQEENMKQLQDLKDERQQMMQQLEDVAQQRDFYRDERNRLRELVSQTELRHLVHGPKTPPLRVHIPSSQGYLSESSSVDLPQPRRRQDDRPEFTTPVYGPPSGGPPHGLPAMHGQSYGAPPPRPLSAASSASGERLPPLRSMEGPPHPAPGLAHGHPQEQDLRTGQWRAAQSLQYETGWATARKPQDAHQWQ